MLRWWRMWACCRAAAAPAHALQADPGRCCAGVFRDRLEALRLWLLARPERCIALVAHAGVLSHLTGAPIRNAELRTVRARDLAVRGMGWSN